MAASESIQYFQFDSTGNLFVFEPGAGCSGPCVKVEPGFEMSEISQCVPSSDAFSGSVNFEQSSVLSHYSTGKDEKSSDNIATEGKKR